MLGLGLALCFGGLVDFLIGLLAVALRLNQVLASLLVAALGGGLVVVVVVAAGRRQRQQEHCFAVRAVVKLVGPLRTRGDGRLEYIDGDDGVTLVEGSSAHTWLRDDASVPEALLAKTNLGPLAWSLASLADSSELNVRDVKEMVLLCPSGYERAALLGSAARALLPGVTKRVEVKARAALPSGDDFA